MKFGHNHNRLFFQATLKNTRLWWEQFSCSENQSQGCRAKEHFENVDHEEFNSVIVISTFWIIAVVIDKIFGILGRLSSKGSNRITFSRVLMASQTEKCLKGKICKWSIPLKTFTKVEKFRRKHVYGTSWLEEGKRINYSFLQTICIKV